MTPDSTRRIRRMVLAASVALALGAAGCGQSPDLDVQTALSQPEEDLVDEGAPDEGEPVTDAPDTSEPDPEPEPETPASDEPASDEPAPDETAPDETAPDEPAPDEPAPDEPAADEPATDESDSDEPATDQVAVLERGDDGDAVEVLQQRLEELGYWLGPTDGSYGELTEQAVLAFQGWEGLPRDGRVGPDTRAALTTATRPVPDADGDLIEVHRDEQVLLLVEDGRTDTVLHVSTGTGERYTQPSGHEAVADTPVGEWEISWRVDGWRQSDLGRLWRPAYFHERGIAIHGYPEVPAHPASHGCVRVSIAAMNMLWAEGHVTEGTQVVVS